ncbi:hypothetical protein IQ07DRAFT_636299 [Pyrenochaeta sp. DS3sAY3a]|nr:hypothetical protein IQ07DRAFT_636299 [Pyrenochaeta sp. DS3sAY3a]
MDSQPRRRDISPVSAGRTRKRGRATNSADQATTKRRNQNRLSQQQHRRKQQAHIRTLESFIETVKDCSGAEDREGKYTRLLEAHTELIEENRRLQDTLNNMRRKLLNFANELDFATCSTGVNIAEDSTTRCEPGRASNDFNFTAVQIDPFTNEDVIDQQDSVTQPQFEDLDNVTQLWQDMEIPETAISHEISDPNDVVEVSDLAQPYHELVSNGLTDATILYRSVVYPQPCLFPLPSQNTTLSSATVFADEILGAAKKLKLQWNGSTPVDPFSTSSGIDLDIAPAAVQVMGSLAGLESYIYPTRFSLYLEHVIRWRISRSPKDFLAVPEPFRPTPLQCDIENHPAVIDFINWPSIRDQLLGCAGSLDLDTVCRDVVLNTVVDLDSFGCSVNIHDLLFNYVLPRVKGLEPINGKSSMLHTSSWTYLQLEQSDIRTFENAHATPAETALAKKIANRLSSGKNKQSELLAALSPGMCQKASSGFDEWSLSALLSSFNVHEVTRWRLSRNFARKYPYINCSSVIADYETVNCKTEAFRSKILDSPISP